jgi:hypothetical protein
MILGWTDPDPRLIYWPGKCLLAAFSVIGIGVSPLSPLPREDREQVRLCLPVAAFLGWAAVLFVFPMHHGWDGQMNAGICGAFGLGFSMDVWRHSNDNLRAYGKISFFVHLGIVLLALAGIPAVLGQS